MRSVLDRSSLKRLLVSTALPLALMTAGAVGVHAEIVTVVGDNGAGGVDGVSPPGDPNGQPGGDGEAANADAGNLVPNSFPLNQATATGGNGGAGGNGVGDVPVLHDGVVQPYFLYYESAQMYFAYEGRY